MSQVAQVKDAINIVDVIGAVVTLQRAGTNFKGLCPFHNERSPSFFVSETMQRFKCFGCGKTGDAFTFLEEYEGMTFYEALQTLADEAGIELKTTAPTQDDEERQQILEILDLSRAYYHYLLTEHKAGAEARAYLKERGVTNDTIKQYQLGVSLDSWDGLVKYLTRKKKYHPELVIKAGLAIKGKHPIPYDRFRSRVMFPLKNHRGQVVGFSGRTLKTDKDEPKYINTPETMVYHKSKLLYGYSEQLQPIRQERMVVVVEGEFDAISSAQAHVRTCVAIKGSALTSDHAEILARSVDRIILSLDADAAGIEATRKAIEVVRSVSVSREQPLLLQVIRIPQGKDPDDLSRNDPKRWRELVKKPMTAYEFLITMATEQHDAESPEGKREIMAELTPVLAGITHAVEREHYVQEVAQKLRSSVKSVQTDIDQYLKRKAHGVSDRNTEGSATDQEKTEKKPTKKPLTKKGKLEGYLLFLLAQFAPDKRKRPATEFESLAGELPGIRQVVAQLKESTAEYGKALKSLPEDIQQTAFEWLLNPKFSAFDTTEQLEAEWQTQLKLLQREFAQERGKIIEEKLAALDAQDELSPEEEAEQQQLLQELVKLRSTA